MEGSILCGSSNGVDLVFPISNGYNDSVLHANYQRDLHKLNMKYYGLIRKQHGIFASNQDKFVDSVDKFNSFDCTFMEDEYKKHKKGEEQ